MFNAFAYLGYVAGTILGDIYPVEQLGVAAIEKWKTTASLLSEAKPVLYDTIIHECTTRACTDRVLNRSSTTCEHVWRYKGN